MTSRMRPDKGVTVMYRRILVPIDGSTTAMAGLQHALRIAAGQNAQLRVVSVVDDFAIARHFDGYVQPDKLVETLRGGAKKVLKNALALAAKHGVKADSTLYETVGERVADVIVREAKKWKADLIAMGTHGR